MAKQNGRGLAPILASAITAPLGGVKGKAGEGQKTRRGWSLRIGPGTLLLALVALLALSSVSAAFTYDQIYSQRVAAGVFFHDVDLSGVSYADAGRLVQKRLDAYRRSPILFVSDEPAAKPSDEAAAAPEPRKWWATPADFGVRFDSNAILGQVLAAGHEGGAVDRLQRQWRLRERPLVIEPAGLTLDDRLVQEILDGLSGELNRPMVNASLKLDSGEVQIVRAQSGQRLDRGPLPDALRDRVRRLSTEPITLKTLTVEPTVTEQDLAPVKDLAVKMTSSPITLTFEDRSWSLDPARLTAMLRVRQEATVDGRVNYFPYLDPAALGDYALELAPGIQRQPKEGRFEFRNGQLAPIRNPEPGVQLDVNQLAQQIQQAALGDARSFPLPITVVKPKLALEDIPTSGVRELVGQASLPYSYSNPARAHNIELGARELNGVIVGPGETFSFNGVVGDTSPDKGYGQGFAIINDKYVLDYGGGICQVATTLYQAVYFSGYVIEQRFEHAYRIRAYEIKPELAGIDATVYYPYVDFQFTNNTDVPLLVSAQAGGGRVTISLYSTKPNWTVQTDRPVLTNQTPKGGVDIINRRTVTDATGNQRVYNSTSHYDRTEG